MMKAERDAINARIKELIKHGVEKEMAKIMAKAEFDCGVIKPVVYY